MVIGLIFLVEVCAVKPILEANGLCCIDSRSELFIFLCFFFPEDTFSRLYSSVKSIAELEGSSCDPYSIDGCISACEPSESLVPKTKDLDTLDFNGCLIYLVIDYLLYSSTLFANIRDFDRKLCLEKDLSKSLISSILPALALLARIYWDILDLENDLTSSIVYYSLVFSAVAY